LLNDELGADTNLDIWTHAARKVDGIRICVKTNPTARRADSRSQIAGAQVGVVALSQTRALIDPRRLMSPDAPELSTGSLVRARQPTCLVRGT
jgi:hypothetical protein